MNVFASVIRRPIGVTLLALGLTLAGILAYALLGVAALPQLDIPAVFVQASQPGASATTMATTVAAPLERHLGRIAGVSDMQSTSSEGASFVVLQFDLDRNIDDAARDVQAAINAAAPDLPSNLPVPPQLFKFNTSEIPVLLLALTSDAQPPAKLYDLADTVLAPRIAQLPGISRAQVFGGAPPAIRVDLDLDALAAKDLSTDEIRNALTAANVTSPLGTLSDGRRNLRVSANDQLHDADDFAHLLIAVRDNVPVRLGDVAHVYDGAEDARQAAWFNGRRAVMLQINKRPGANAVATVAAIKAQIPQLAAWLPADVKVQPIFDLTTTTEASINEVELTLLISLALVVMVMLLFLRRMGPTLIAALSVPLSLAGSLVVMWALGYTLNNLSLMALVMCIGFVVDDAIVVIENIVRHIEAGERPFEAALTGLKEIGFTVISITVSLIAVFAPLLFESSMLGMLLREFSVTLAAAVVISALVSLTLTPALCAHMLRHDSVPHAHEKSRWAHVLERFDDALIGIYRRALDWAMRHRRLMRWQPFLLLLLTGGLVFATLKTAGATFVPAQDTGLLQARIEADTNVSFSQLDRVQGRIARIVQRDPAVLNVSSVLGGGNGGAVGNSGQLFIDLKPFGAGTDHRHDKAPVILERLRKAVADVPGASTSLRGVQFIGGGGGGGNQGAQYSFQLRGDDTVQLQQWTLKMVDALRKDSKLRDVSSDFDHVGQQQNVHVDRQRASRLGVSMATVEGALYGAFGQQPVSTIYSDVNDYRVIMSASPKQVLSPASLLGLHVQGSGGGMVPLSAVADIRPGIAPPSVTHQDQVLAASIGYGLAPKVAPSEGTSIIEATARRIGLPDALHVDFTGDAQRQRQLQSNFLPLLLAAVLAMYLVLGILYESLRHPLTILSTLPAASVGAFLAMLLTGTQVSLMAIIAMLLLIGIVKKNAILMVDFALTAERERGLEPVAAIREAALTRFRPILMTTMVAMLSAVPLAIGFGVGSEMRQPLGIAMIGGLAVSQLLTLLSTPAIYLGRHDRLIRKAARRERRAARKRGKLQAAGT